MKFSLTLLTESKLYFQVYKVHHRVAALRVRGAAYHHRQLRGAGAGGAFA